MTIAVKQCPPAHSDDKRLSDLYLWASGEVRRRINDVQIGIAVFAENLPANPQGDWPHQAISDYRGLRERTMRWKFLTDLHGLLVEFGNSIESPSAEVSRHA